MIELNTFVMYTPIVVGIWMLTLVLWIDANGNFLSKLIFKIVPFFLGLASLYTGLVLTGVL